MFLMFRHNIKADKNLNKWSYAGCMKHKYARKPSEHINIAKERIGELFRQADLVFGENKTLANRYISLARNISMRYKVKIPHNLKRKFCKHCYRYLKPGVNCRVRIAKKRVIYYCLSCKRFMRFVINKSSKKKNGNR